MRKHFLSFGIVMVLVVMFFATTAFTSTSAHAATSPHARACGEGWVADSFTKLSDTDNPDGTPQIIVNNTNQTITRVVSTTTTYTLSATVSYNQEVGFTQLAATEKATLGITVQGTISIANGETTTIPVGAHKSVKYGDYIHTDTFSYHEYYRLTDCSIGTDNGYVSFTAPEYKYWRADNI